MIEFTIPVPPSLKNGKVLGRQFGSTKVTMRVSSAVRESMRLVQHEAREAMLFSGVDECGEWKEPLFGDDDIGVDMVYHARRGELTVRVWSEGSRPPKFSGRKRDLQNLQDGVLDALQGLLYANDNQVTKLTMQRRLD